MHTVMIAMALFSAVIMRRLWSRKSLDYPQRWQHTLFYFLFPPLLLLMTAMAVLGMGTQGKMLGWESSWMSYAAMFLFLLAAIATLLWQFYLGARSRYQLPNYQTLAVAGYTAHILPLSVPYSAQIGWRHPQLVVSEGLLSILDHAHLEAVMAHEQAHLHYRDTFWFFWLGWLYRTTAWLPNSRNLWEELLLLRELRADCKASQTVDPLLLAESLVTVAQFQIDYPEVGCAGLSCTANQSRLEERIEALMNQEQAMAPPLVNLGRELVWSLTPLLTIPWHQS